MEDAGTSGAEIGCGDSLVATYTEDVTFTDQLRVTMAKLLANQEQFLGESGLYNALYLSNLEFTSGSTSGDVVTVELTGELILGGTCDAPRVKAQLEQTAMTATGSGKAEVFVNGGPLDQLLSGK